MRIYHLTAREPERVGYDSYTEHVVMADTEQEARCMVPNGNEGEHFWTDPQRSLSRHIGAALRHLPAQVVMSSYERG